MREYFNHSSKNLDRLGQSEKNENYHTDEKPIVVRKYGSSNFKPRERNNGEITDRVSEDQQVFSKLCTKCTQS